MAKEFRLTKGWPKLKIMLDPNKFRSRVKTQFAKAMRLAALEAVAEIRRVIKRGVPPSNRPLTAAIKRSSKPLVDKGDLFGAITYQLSGHRKAFVGVLKTNAQYNIAVALHQGTTISVTPKMRSLFWHLWLKSEVDPSIELRGRAAELWARYKGPWYPISMHTRAIVIPGRPFILRAFRKGTMRKKIRGIWEQALSRALAAA
jgi:hypothetical protein